MKEIFMYWVEGSFWNKAFLIFAVLMLFLAAIFFVQHKKENPRKKLAFLVDAQKNNCMSVGKLCCLTSHGDNGVPETLRAEYIYVVDDKSYYVTYEMAYEIQVDDNQENTNGDMLVMNIKPAMILFYDKDDPSKVMSKFEVFTSYEAMHQVETLKENVWRDVDKDWTEPVRLVKY